MNEKLENPVSSVIVSVYKDDVALRHILISLNRQTVSNFEIIVSEDCQSDSIKKCLNGFIGSGYDSGIPIQHLIQEDIGFRKNRALNRALCSANADHLIFIDGDCVPHPEFVNAHQRYANRGVASSGRRVEVGERISARLRADHDCFKRFSNNFYYLLSIIPLIQDRSKNIECGLYSRFLQSLTKNRKTRLLGCNFSCNKRDLIDINGFNEDYIFPGTGEDTDVDWRLRRIGVELVNIKFSAIQYHLHHARTYNKSADNQKILKRTKQLDQYVCRNGISKVKQ